MLKKLKWYNWIAIFGLILATIGTYVKLTNLALTGLGIVMLCVPFSINDNLNKK